MDQFLVSDKIIYSSLIKINKIFKSKSFCVLYVRLSKITDCSVSFFNNLIGNVA